MKLEQLVELLSASKGFIFPRARWQNAAQYPTAESADSKMWAWEFLRRNAFYCHDASKAGAEQDPESLYRLSFGWGVSRVVPPHFSFDEIKSGADGSKEELEFDGGSVGYHAPYLTSDEFDAQNQIPFFGARHVLNHSVLTTGNHLLVSIHLDGNIETQIDSIRQLISRDEGELVSRRNARYVFVEESSSRKLKSKSGKADLVSVRAKIAIDREPIKVHWSHLWLALRCVDALGETFRDHIEPDKIILAAREHFNRELGEEITPMQPFLKRGQEPWSTQKIVDYFWFGLRYVLESRYITIASTDLQGQLSGFRSRRK